MNGTSRTDTPETVVESAPVAAPASSPAISRVSSAPTAEEGRFVPGTLLGGRYRIIALLGRGGMGEIYRATDLTLGQSVALKFLPHDAVRDERMLERFNGEVRVARAVSHPNVCRVYDVGEVEGMPFISMEYVDGEDLASLLTRIGRLPADRALAVARKLCAGLAAAHDKGVIHRDLKPLNIMMNKRGEVVIMDFGLAAIAEELSGAEARDGTPAYMSPEQLRGAGVTAKSDIYALGLVLYELFTGRKPFAARTIRELIEQQEAVQLASMSSVAADIDPAVERAIRRCLDPDPAKRPTSALAVAAALPGGDPLAAALAAGETPSPEAVAAAGVTEGLPRKIAIACLGLVALGLLSVTVVRERWSTVAHADLALSPDVLSLRARETAAALGWERKPADTALRLEHRRTLIDHLKKLPAPRRWGEWFAAEAPVAAVYREGQELLLPEPYGVISDNEPPPIDPGMVRVVLDGAGRLRSFDAVPYRDGGSPAAPVDDAAVFRAAGIEMAAFAEGTPAAQPVYAADSLREWKGPHPSIPGVELGVEIGSWQGRITRVRIAGPWTDKPSAAGGGERSFIASARDVFVLAIATTMLLFMVLLARRNWTLGRVDKNGALRLATAVFVLNVLVWLGDLHAIPSLSLIGFFFASCGSWLLGAATVWLLYLALEPAVRSRWPHSIVTWNRVLAGRWHDAQVNGHALIGAAVGCVVFATAEAFQHLLGARDTLAPDGRLTLALGARHWVAGHAGIVTGALVAGLIFFFVIFGLRTLLKRDWLAALATSVLFTITQNDAFSSGDWVWQVPMSVAIFAVLIFVLLRVGLVATAAMIFMINSLNAIPLGGGWDAWYAPAGLASLALLAALALLAFRRSLGSRQLVED